MRTRSFRFLAALASLLLPGTAAADDAGVRRAADAAAKAIMRQHDVPGLAIAVTQDGRRQVFNYGVANRKSGQAVNDDTIFEIGSISKVYTASLGAVATAGGMVSDTSPAGTLLPWLDDGALAKAPLEQLLTYTAGGLPLQFPDDVKDTKTMEAWYRNWRPGQAPGTSRTYSNPSIGLYGAAVAAGLGGAFDDLMMHRVFQPLHLDSTFIHVPDSRQKDYAWGYNRNGKPVRVNPGMLASEAYGVKTTALDLAGFLEAHMDPASLGGALAATQQGRYRIGPMTQAAGWEFYADPADLDALLAGNSRDMAMKAQPAQRLVPMQPAAGSALYNKTGATGGFGAYAAFIPETRTGIVILANRNYPNEDRVKAGHALLKALGAIAP